MIRNFIVLFCMQGKIQLKEEEEEAFNIIIIIVLCSSN